MEVLVPPEPDWSSSPHIVEVVVPPGPDWSSSPHVHGNLPLYTTGDAGDLVKRYERKPLFIMQRFSFLAFKVELAVNEFTFIFKFSKCSRPNHS